MNILYLTAGAAGMYCGSCLRDNALARELMAQGHHVTLLPLYTPTLTDEPNVSERRVFFGGVSVYLEQRFSFFRHTPRFLDRLWDSPWVLRALAGRSVSIDPRRLGELTVSMLKGEHGHQQKELAKLLDWLETQPLPDVVDLQNSLLLGLAGPLKKVLKRPLCCTLQGEDLFLDGLGEAYRSTALELMRANIDAVDAFIAVSEYYAAFMSSYLGIPRDKIRVVPLGINLEGFEVRPRHPSKTFTIGYMARVAPEKGLHVLAEAFRNLHAPSGPSPLRLEVAGYLGPQHREYLEGIEQRMRDWGLADNFRYHGVVSREEKIRFLKTLDVLSVPCVYNEPKGIFVLEAMACGVPVIQPRRGAFPEIIQKTGGGILVEPDNVESLAEGIRALWHDPALAHELGRRGSESVRRHYSVTQMAQRMLEVYGSLGEASAPKQVGATLAQPL